MSGVLGAGSGGGGGSGDVEGPASSTDNAVVRYDGTTGKLVQNSAVTVDDSDNVTGVVDLTTTGALDAQGTSVTLGGDGTTTTTFKSNGANRVQLVGGGATSGLYLNTYQYNQELAAAGADYAGYGQIWVKNDVPNTLWFTDDAGTDTQLGVGGGGGMSDLVDDLTPQLGGDLDLNSKSIDFPTTANVSDCLDEDTMVSDSATALATQQSIKAYVDTTVAAPDGTVAITVYNDTGSTLNEGKAVYISGYKAGNEVPTVALAKADAAGTMPAAGLVQSNISNNSEGTIVVLGQLQGIDTTAWNVGDTLFVDPSTAGDLTTTKPVAANLIQNVGKVTRDNVSLGVIQVAGALRSNDVPNFTAADKYWYGGTGGVTTEGAITAAARTVLDDATVAAMLVTLGAAPIVGEYPIGGWLNDIMGWPEGSGYNTSPYQIPALPALPQPPSMEGMGNPGANDVSAGWTNCIVPRGYVAATHTLKVRIRCKWHTQQANTTHAIDLQAYEDGAGADICATAQQNVTNAFANYDFTITDTNLVAGDQVSLLVACILDDTGGVAAQPITEITNITLVVA